MTPARLPSTRTEAVAGAPRPGRAGPSPAATARGAWFLLAALLALSSGASAQAPPGSAQAPPGSAQAPAASAQATLPRVGPANGTVIVAGGGTLGSEIWERFVSLAGGPAAEIVVIPTAAAEDTFPDDWEILLALRAAGATRITLLHTRDRGTADSESFAAPLRTATGVWIPGGRQHRLAQAYLHTQVHEGLAALLARGGVIGGTSAGASIQASFLVRGDPDTNTIVLSPEYMEGFGFLVGTAVDQHLLARNREADLWQVLDLRPDLLGIGLDEGTALVIRGDRAEVIGASQAIFYDATGPRRATVVLEAGGWFDLGDRERLVQ